MCVTIAAEAEIAQEAGAVAVMALEKAPADVTLQIQLGSDGIFVGSGIINLLPLKRWQRILSKQRKISTSQTFWRRVWKILEN